MSARIHSLSVCCSLGCVTQCCTVGGMQPDTNACTLEKEASTLLLEALHLQFQVLAQTFNIKAMKCIRVLNKNFTERSNFVPPLKEEYFFITTLGIKS